jgi:hypothetical protein
MLDGRGHVIFRHDLYLVIKEYSVHCIWIWMDHEDIVHSLVKEKFLCLVLIKT